MEWRLARGFTRFQYTVGPDQIMTALLRGRGVGLEEEETFFSPDYDRDLHDPFLFRDMDRVMRRIGQAREQEEKVAIFGDFDADGVTSSVILREALEVLGFTPLIYIPHKLEEGHGLSYRAIERFHAEGVKLIFTLDCGMMNHVEIHEARLRGIETIIIDHHHVPEVLPEAVAIINPKLLSDRYPFRELCGAGTSFKVATALYEYFLPERREELKWLLDLAAIGTVADVMPLIGENRVLVKYGLIVLQKTRRPGLQELYRVGRILLDQNHAPTARVIAFQIAPRINAASRMAHAETAHELLATTNQAHSRVLALELEGYNDARRKVTQVVAETVRTIAVSQFSEKKYIVAAQPDFPLGVVGLVAGKIAEEFGKPTALFQRGPEISVGSFRSIPGLSIIEVLEQCSDLFVKYGGHDQAAGLTIANDRFPEFLERYDEILTEKLARVDTKPELLLDLEIMLPEVTLELVERLETLAPFGEGNEEPIFVFRKVVLREVRKVGKENEHWKLLLESMNQVTVEAVGWSLVSLYPHLTVGMRVDIAGHLSKNRWNGSETVQIVIEDIQVMRGGEN